MAQREENGRGNFSVDNFSGGWLTINTRKGEGKTAKETRENSKRDKGKQQKGKLELGLYSNVFRYVSRGDGCLDLIAMKRNTPVTQTRHTRNTVRELLKERRVQVLCSYMVLL